MRIRVKKSSPCLGFTPIEIVIVVGVVFAIGFILFWLSDCYGTRSVVSRVKADQRTVHTALESYFVDYGVYPAERPLSDLTDRHDKLKEANGWKLATIEQGRGESFPGITTPTAYILSLFSDPYAPDGDLSFAYSNDLIGGWILFSPGPDRDYDIDPKIDYGSRSDQLTPTLVHKTYDPTNGMVSGGDIWRVKE